MPRPRESRIPERQDTCKVHGVTTFRQHRVGFTPKGEQKYRWRCMDCHAGKKAP